MALMVKTDAALRTFQSLHCLAVEGICGPATWAALLAEPEIHPPADNLYVVAVPGL